MCVVLYLSSIKYFLFTSASQIFISHLFFIDQQVQSVQRTREHRNIKKKSPKDTHLRTQKIKFI